SPYALSCYSLSLHDALPISFKISNFLPKKTKLKAIVNLAKKLNFLFRTLIRKCIRSFLEVSANSSNLKESSSNCSWYRLFDAPRSDEHTSELQSRENLVCRL